jgi:CO dehydrogenase maturation factor
MKVAFVGKGGAGKTTITAMVARHLVHRSLPVLAIDADINQHLGESLGMKREDAQDIPSLGLEMKRIKKYLVGSNQHIKDASEMIKTTPPGPGSRLLQFAEANPLYDYFVREVAGIRVMAVGSFGEEDLGVKCYHSKTGAVELLLNHLIDTAGQYVLVDMTAGADSFASGLFTRFDVTFVVVEPTVKSISVYEQYKEYVNQYQVQIRVIGNKVSNEYDLNFIRDRVGTDLIATCSHSEFIRSMEQGEIRPITELEPENQKVLQRIVSEIDRQEKDWDNYYAQAVEFHKKNAHSWANSSLGTDVTQQIDPTYSFRDAIEYM